MSGYTRLYAIGVCIAYDHFWSSPLESSPVQSSPAIVDGHTSLPPKPSSIFYYQLILDIGTYTSVPQLKCTSTMPFKVSVELGSVS